VLFFFFFFFFFFFPPQILQFSWHKKNWWSFGNFYFKKYKLHYNFSLSFWWGKGLPFFPISWNWKENPYVNGLISKLDYLWHYISKTLQPTEGLGIGRTLQPRQALETSLSKFLWTFYTCRTRPMHEVGLRKWVLETLKPKGSLENHGQREFSTFY